MGCHSANVWGGRDGLMVGVGRGGVMVGVGRGGVMVGVGRGGVMVGVGSFVPFWQRAPNIVPPFNKGGLGGICFCAVTANT